MPKDWRLHRGIGTPRNRLIRSNVDIGKGNTTHRHFGQTSDGNGGAGAVTIHVADIKIPEIGRATGYWVVAGFRPFLLFIIAVEKNGFSRNIIHVDIADINTVYQAAATPPAFYPDTHICIDKITIIHINIFHSPVRIAADDSEDYYIRGIFYIQRQLLQNRLEY